MKKIFNILILFVILFSLNVNVVCAADGYNDTNKSVKKANELSNPLGDSASTDINILIGKIINAVLGIVGSLALLMFIYGGFIWMTARGNNEAIKKGKDVLVWAIIGMIVIFASYAAVSFVLKEVIQGN